MNDHLFGKELFIRFTASAFRKLRSIYVFSYFPFGFEGRMWDLIVSVPDHCLSFYFTKTRFISSIFRLSCISLWYCVREHIIYTVYSDCVLVFAFPCLSCKEK